MYKRIVAIMLAVALACSTITTALAADLSTNETAINEINESTEARKGIIETLNNIEYAKKDLGLEGIDFSKLKIGVEIPAYEYKDNKITKLFDYYPLYLNHTLKVLAINVDDKYQIDTSLAYKINEMNCKEAAIIYDADGCYLYDGLKLNLLYNSTIVHNERASLTESASLVNFSDLATANLEIAEDLNYQFTTSTYAPTYFSCNVQYVTQNPYDYLCWAACIAMVINTVYGTSYTARDISKMYFGSFKDDVILSSKIEGFLEDKFNYKTVTKYVADDLLLDSIKRGNPVYTAVDLEMNQRGAVHAVTTYGINLISGYVTVIDPTFGSTTAFLKDNFYSYRNVVDGYIYYLTWTLYNW